jgi:1-acyl-sn-glycerol-3-phosphate acyltransferase/uncharacterized membrane protein
MPVIIAPNHQNALMDAMIFTSLTSFQNVFLARADIFKPGFLTRLLTYLNIMPIFRIRDGIENVKRNDEVFDKTTRVLHNRHNPLVIFPEGNHGDRRRLRPLVKGLFRIAFQAQEKFGTSPAVKIVPVGVDYGHYQNFRTTLLVNVGEPIEISAFYNDYAENPVTAINNLKDIYAARLSKLIIDIQTEDFYPLYMDLREIFNDNMRSILGIKGKSLFDKFCADKVMIEILDKELENDHQTIIALNELVKTYRAETRMAGLRYWVLNNRSFSFINLIASVLSKIVLLPVFLFGSLNNLVPYLFTASRVTGIKDRQFHSSFKYVVGMIAFPVWYLILAGIMAFLSLPFWFIILYVLLLPLTGVAAFEYYIRLRKFLGRSKYTFRRNSREIISLKEKRQNIIKVMSEMVNRHKNLYEYPR